MNQAWICFAPRNVYSSLIFEMDAVDLHLKTSAVIIKNLQLILNIHSVLYGFIAYISYTVPST